MHTYVFEHALSNGTGFKKIDTHHLGSKMAILGSPGPTGSPIDFYPKGFSEIQNDKNSAYDRSTQRYEKMLEKV
jgi:hypothetical protein